MQTYIIHVKGNEKREKFILSEVTKKGLNYEFILEGNKEDITPELYEKLFAKNVQNLPSVASCAFKHMKAYERIVKNNLPYALILEDDITLYDNCNATLNKIIEEIEKRQLKNFLISLEDSQLEYIPRSELVKNQLLYQKEYGRMAGAYLLDYQAAKTILEFVATNKLAMPIDWLHNFLAADNFLTIYWAEPVIACQGSLNGKMLSLIDNKQQGWLRQISFFLQRHYKKAIYYFR
jgi:glycosyl transferase family 25